jgi:hypothetical protein
MCRNIKTLFNFTPPATADEVHDASLQFVRKLSGSTKPSKANEAAFITAVQDIEKIVQQLLGALVSSVPAKNREVEAEKARRRTAMRFGR